MARNMTSRQRVMAAFGFSEPDRVPAWLGASPEWRELAREDLGLADDESVSRHIRDDFRRVTAVYAGPEELGPAHDLQPGATYRTPFGVERHGYGYGQPMSYLLARASSLHDIDAYPWPDPQWMDVTQIRREAVRYGGEFAILGGDWSPFYHDAIDLLGMEGLYLRMFDAPVIVDAVLDHLVDY